MVLLADNFSDVRVLQGSNMLPFRFLEVTECISVHAREGQMPYTVVKLLFAGRWRVIVILPLETSNVQSRVLPDRIKRLTFQ